MQTDKFCIKPNAYNEQQDQIWSTESLPISSGEKDPIQWCWEAMTTPVGRLLR